MPIAEKIPSSPDQGSACVGKRCVLCTVALQGQIKPRTACDIHAQTASIQVLTDRAYIITPHLIYPQQQAIMIAVCLMHAPTL